MDKKQIIRFIKSGRTNDEIYHAFLLERTPAVAPKYSYFREREDTLDGFIKSFLGLGYTIISLQDNVKEEWWNGKRFHTIVKFDTKLPGIVLIVKWTKRPDYKQKKWLFNITLTDENHKDINLEFGEKHQKAISAVSETVNEWGQIQSEWSELLDQVKKLRKKINVGNSTIEAILQNYLLLNKFPYNIYKEKGDTYLRIKLNYRRYLEFKLSPTMGMTNLTQISQMVETVAESLKSVGNINLTVKNFGTNINWVLPTSINEEGEL